MGLSLKEAVRIWEDQNKNCDVGRAEEIHLNFGRPIHKLDNTLSLLTSVKMLSLSSNCIDKIVGFQNLKNLTVLSLARNHLRDLSGLEVLNESLQELWISHNFIEKLKVLLSLTKLKVLYMSYNLIKDWKEVNTLKDLEMLEDVLLMGNPFTDGMDEEKYHAEIIARLPQIKIIDGDIILRDSE